MNIIETHALSRRFGKTEAVSELSWTLPAGSTCALLGSNGAGKTTTLKLLLNLLQPSGGHARVLGCDSRALGPTQFEAIGYVCEGQRLPAWMTVREFLDYCRPFYPTWDRSLERTLLEQFSLPPHRRLKDLSRGMAMKASLLAALAYRPRLLILDEPFSGLDALVRDELISGLIEVSNDQEWTIVVSSHDIDEVERLCDHVAYLEGGSLRLSESVEALQARFRRVEVSSVPADITPPESALQWERSGSLGRFIETRYAGSVSHDSWATLLGGSPATASPMSLREIFLALARAERASKGAIS